MADEDVVAYVQGLHDRVGGDVEALAADVEAARAAGRDVSQLRRTLPDLDAFVAAGGDEALVAFARGWRDRLAGIVDPPGDERAVQA